MAGLVCPGCGLSYDGARLPHYLGSASGASCPRCAAPLGESSWETGVERRSRSTSERHRVAVERSVGWAERAAAEGDFAEALAWLATIEAVGDRLPAGVDGKRRAWMRAARATTADG